MTSCNSNWSTSYIAGSLYGETTSAIDEFLPQGISNSDVDDFFVVSITKLLKTVEFPVI